MKIRNIVIVILLAIVCGQFIQFFLLLKKFDRLKFAFEHHPVEVYVAGLTERIREVDRLKTEVMWQARWLSKRLDKCIERLEAEQGLEPIPVEYPQPEWAKYLKSDPNVARKYTSPPEPFYEPYESPNNPPLEDVEEGRIKVLMCQLNLQQLALKMALMSSEKQIENYEKRLERLDPNRP